MILYTSNWMLFLPLAISLFVGLRLVLSAADTGSGRFGFWFVHSLIVAMAIVGVLSIGFRISWLSIAWLVELFVFMMIVHWKKRAHIRTALVQPLLLARGDTARRSILQAFRDGNKGWLRRKAKRLLHDTLTGVHWIDATVRRRIARSFQQQLALNLAKERPDFAEPDSRHEASWIDSADVEVEVDRLVGQLSVTVLYAFLVPIVLIIRFFIVPIFQELLEDFDVALPHSMELFKWLLNPASAVVFSLVMLLLTGPALVTSLFWVFPGLLRWPGLRWIVARYHQNLGLLTLAKTAKHESNLITACELAGRVNPLRHERQVYTHLAQSLSNGVQPSAAFHSAGLVDKHKEASLSAQLDESAPSWTISQIAFERTALMLRQYGLLVNLWLILNLLVSACIVTLVGASIFESMADILYSGFRK